MKIDIKAFALAGAIIWGLLMAVTTLISLNTGYAEQFLNLFASIYPGYTITTTGIFVGGIYGFIDAFIGCYLFAWLYNKLAK